MKESLYNLPVTIWNASNGKYSYLIVPTYKLDYQDPGSEILGE